MFNTLASKCHPDRIITRKHTPHHKSKI
uniref:Uncharacterized protein n=1 Tax=Anguilla anguilla TaxID=7936 RepID=A0A0E9PD46_ANGAN